MPYDTIPHETKLPPLLAHIYPHADNSPGSASQGFPAHVTPSGYQPDYQVFSEPAPQLYSSQPPQQPGTDRHFPPAQIKPPVTASAQHTSGLLHTLDDIESQADKLTSTVFNTPEDKLQAYEAFVKSLHEPKAVITRIMSGVSLGRPDEELVHSQQYREHIHSFAVGITKHEPGIYSIDPQLVALLKAMNKPLASATPENAIEFSRALDSLLDIPELSERRNAIRQEERERVNVPQRAENYAILRKDPDYARAIYMLGRRLNSERSLDVFNQPALGQMLRDVHACMSDSYASDDQRAVAHLKLDNYLASQPANRERLPELAQARLRARHIPADDIAIHTGKRPITDDDESVPQATLPSKKAKLDQSES